MDYVTVEQVLFHNDLSKIGWYKMNGMKYHPRGIIKKPTNTKLLTKWQLMNPLLP